MKKSTSDARVKKTLLRNYETKVKPTARNQFVRSDVACSSGTTYNSYYLNKENELNTPLPCSSEVIANYLADVKKSTPPPFSSEDLNVCKGQISAKVTKKLNFHFKDSIFKNLIELNGNIDAPKTRKERRPNNIMNVKKDLEPNIEDFYEDEKETDTPPDIPVFKPKYKPIRKMEDGRLHKLVAEYENL